MKIEQKDVVFYVRNFPVLSETFVFNQVKSLVNAGLKVEVLSVNPVNDDNGMLTNLFGEDWNNNVKSILPKTSKLFFNFYSILGLFSCIFIPKRFHLVKLYFDLISKGQFFWAKDLMAQVWFARRLDTVAQSCVSHFGNNGVILDKLRTANIIRAKNLFTIFHGYEISRYDQLHIWGKYYGSLKGTYLPISKHWKEKLIELGACERNIRVLHMGVDVEKFNFEDKRLSTPLRILSVARATEKKGLRYAIEAVLNSQNESHYRIIGGGTLLDELKQQVTEHPHKHRVEFLGAQPSDVVASELKRTDLFLLPSVQDRFGDKEGIPVSLMEAMASGVLVLSTHHSGIPELVMDGGTGFLVPEKNSLEITNTINKIKDSKNLTNIRLSARKKIESEFNENTLKDELIELLRKE